MRFLLPISIASILLFKNAEARWTPNQKMTWNIALGDNNYSVKSEDADVVEIDFNKDNLIRELHNAGKKVICYFSGGTIEKWRFDFDQYTKVDGLIKNEYDGWPGEYWVDYRKEGIKPLLRNRFVKAKEKGCDAVDVDNVDGYQVRDVKNNWSNPLTKSDAIKFTTWLGQTAHEVGISIGLKNCLDIVDTVGNNYDFAISEHCIKNDECRYYKNYVKSGKPVFGITYNGLTESNRQALCRNLNGLPITMVIKEGRKLVQKKITFDGNKYCSSDFVSGKVSSPPANENKTTTKPSTTTTTVKVTTTVKQSTPTSNSKNPSSSASNNASDNNSSNGSINNATNGSINNKTNGSTNTPVSGTTTNGINNGTINSATNNGNVNTSIVSGNNTVADASGVNGPNLTQINRGPVGNNNNNNNNIAGNNTEIKDQFDSTTSTGKNHTGTVVTGVAITGSVVGAVAVFAFIKKNPRKYEDLKRGLSRRATSVRRGASSLTRKLTTHGRN